MILFDCARAAERDRGIQAAVEAVKRGDLVVFPTETVYGIGADAFKTWAVTALRNARGMAADLPIPVLVGTRATLDGLVHALPSAAIDVVDVFWPGPLTMIVEHAPSLSWDLGGDSSTMHVRMPLHPVALEVLRETGPMVVTGANRVGSPPAVDAVGAREQLGYSASIFLDSDQLHDHERSTILDLTGPEPTILRAGAISADDLRRVLPGVKFSEIVR
jgi:tRNA threonylcarbamoyl adenosine modification protein (Sua5/YciO/YrdC/YwlC family)